MAVPGKKLMTKSAWVVASGCNNYRNKADAVWKLAGKQKKGKVKACRRTKSDKRDPVITTEKTREAVETPEMKDDKKKPDKVYQDILAFPETDEILLFKSKSSRIFASTGLNSSRMRTIFCVFETGAGPNFIRSDVLD